MLPPPSTPRSLGMIIIGTLFALFPMVPTLPIGSSHALALACPPNQTQSSIFINCQGGPTQWPTLCVPVKSIPMTIAVTTPLTVTYTVGSGHCASIRLRASVDGQLKATSGFLGHFGTLLSASRPKTVTLSLGTVSPGSHTITLQAEGDGIDCSGGSNGVASWAGNATVKASTNQCPSVAQCQDGVDNDGDGLVDFPQDPGCSNADDNDEFNAVTPQCRDGIDNDGDGATDHPADFSCSSPDDDDEKKPKAQCQDGEDNDGDGLKDFPQDPGCSSLQDNDEFNQLPQCSDRVDNDGDGKVDSADPGCHTDGNPGNSASYDPNDGSELDDPVPCTSNHISFSTSDTPDPVRPNEDLVYTIVVSNACSQSQTVSLTSTLDPQTIFLSASDGGTIQGSSTVFWNSLPIPANSSKSLTLHTRVASSAQHNSTLTLTSTTSGKSDTEHTMVVSDGKGAPQCSDTIDNDGDGRIDFPSDPGCTSPQDTDERDDQQGPQLTIDKVGPTTVEQGGTITYTLTVKNTGQGSSEDTVVVDFFDSTVLTYLPDQSTPGCVLEVVASEQHVKCTIGTFAPNQTKVFHLSFRVYPSATCSSTVHNKADVQARNGLFAWDDLFSTVTCNGASPPSPTTRVSITKEANRDEALPNDIILYTVTLKNLTDAPGNNVTITDTIRSGTVSVDDPAGGIVNGSTITWSLPTLAGNGTHTIRYELRVGSAAQHREIIENAVQATSQSFEFTVEDSEEVSVIRSLPQTGISGFLTSRNETNSFLRPATKTVTVITDDMSTFPFVLLTTVASIGLAAGGFVGRKYFL